MTCRENGNQSDVITIFQTTCLQILCTYATVRRFSITETFCLHTQSLLDFIIELQPKTVLNKIPGTTRVEVLRSFFQHFRYCKVSKKKRSAKKGQRKNVRMSTRPPPESLKMSKKENWGFGRDIFDKRWPKWPLLLE